MRDDRECLLRGGDTVVVADLPREIPRPLCEGLCPVEIAALPCLVRPKTDDARPLGPIRGQPLGRLQVWFRQLGLVLHEQRARSLSMQPTRTCRRIRDVEREGEGLHGTACVGRDDSQLADALPELGRQLGLRGLPCTHLLVQPLRLRARLDSELVLERRTQVLVAPQCLAATAGEGVQADQQHMTALA
jgi:hypothetical protein